MTKILMPHYMTNKDWFYWDKRVGRYKLTDKISKKALDSYIDYEVTIHGKLFDEVVEQVEKDIEEYKNNKQRYTIDKENSPQLIAVDGQPLPEQTIDEFLDMLGKNNSKKRKDA